MNYRIDAAKGTPEEISELSAFLAAYVADGELERPRPRDTRREVWEKRLAGWWTENPYCRPEEPKGYVLRNAEEVPVGVYGFIPHDYVYEGRTVPTLISTTFYVRKANRDAALALFMRANRHRKTHQIVDGDPNPPSIALLERTGYVRGPRPTMIVAPVRRRGARPVALLNRLARLVLPREGPLLRSGRIVTDAADVGEVPTAPSEKLRKHCNRDTLLWYQNSGTRRKHFVGWCDGEGVLRCYLLGVPWQVKGQETFVIIKYAAFDEASEALLDDLVLRAAKLPDGTGLPPESDFVVWPVLEERAKRAPFRLPRDLKVYYQVPPELKDAPRAGRAFDGDNIFY